MEAIEKSFQPYHTGIEIKRTIEFCKTTDTFNRTILELKY